MEIRISHNGRQRDSLLFPGVLGGRAIDLMLQIRVRLIRIEPTSSFNISGTYCRGNGVLHDEFGRFHLEQWQDVEWANYGRNLVDIVRRYWDNKFELVPDRPWYAARRGAPLEARPISCSLSLVEDNARPHHRYYIMKPREDDFRSFVDTSRRLGLFTHRDLAPAYNNTCRTHMGEAIHDVSFLQSAVLHEFGHTLGLYHVNGHGNADRNYGITLEQREDVMGMGGRLNASSARPWIRQLRHHLRPENRADRQVHFTARVTEPQLITYWDEDYVAPRR